MSKLPNCEKQPFNVKDEVDSLADWSSWIVMRKINSSSEEPQELETAMRLQLASAFSLYV